MLNCPDEDDLISENDGFTSYTITGQEPGNRYTMCTCTELCMLMLTPTKLFCMKDIVTHACIHTHSHIHATL